MWVRERNTVSRGRSVLPFTRLRIDAFRLSLFSTLVFISFLSARARLADLALDDLFQVLHALALVRLGRAEAAHLGRGLPQELAVEAAQDHQVLVHLGGDPLG